MMDQYAVIFVGTPYMDGKYTKIEGAYNAKESLGKKFPNSRLEIIQVSDKFKLTDDIFWANHKEAASGPKTLENWDDEAGWERWITSFPSDLIQEAIRLEEKESNRKVSLDLALSACIWSKQNSMMLDIKNSLDAVADELAAHNMQLREGEE